MRILFYHLVLADSRRGHEGEPRVHKSVEGGWGLSQGSPERGCAPFAGANISIVSCFPARVCAAGTSAVEHEQGGCEARLRSHLCGKTAPVQSKGPALPPVFPPGAGPTTCEVAFSRGERRTVALEN